MFFNYVIKLGSGRTSRPIQCRLKSRSKWLSYPLTPLEAFPADWRNIFEPILWFLPFNWHSDDSGHPNGLSGVCARFLAPKSPRYRCPISMCVDDECNLSIYKRGLLPPRTVSHRRHIAPIKTFGLLPPLQLRLLRLAADKRRLRRQRSSPVRSL